MNIEEKVLFKNYMSRKYILGQQFDEDGNLKDTHNFPDDELPKEIYELDKDDLIEIIRHAKIYREYECMPKL